MGTPLEPPVPPPLQARLAHGHALRRQQRPHLCQHLQVGLVRDGDQNLALAAACGIEPGAASGLCMHLPACMREGLQAAARGGHPPCAAIALTDTTDRLCECARRLQQAAGGRCHVPWCDVDGSASHGRALAANARVPGVRGAAQQQRPLGGRRAGTRSGAGVEGAEGPGEAPHDSSGVAGGLHRA